MKDEEKRLADAEQKSERRRIQEENVRRKEAAKVKEVKAQERVRCAIGVTVPRALERL